jgi:hypothetical protein
MNRIESLLKFDNSAIEARAHEVQRDVDQRRRDPSAPGREEKLREKEGPTHNRRDNQARHPGTNRLANQCNATIQFFGNPNEITKPYFQFTSAH